VTSMSLVHRRPCAECPWRRTSPQGYLGGNDAYVYADLIAVNKAPNCHMNDEAFCVGSLVTANNCCTQLHATPGAMEAQLAIPERRSPDFFAHPSEFFEYHTGAKWKPRYERLLDGELRT
jgi:hypothetical protein